MILLPLDVIIDVILFNLNVKELLLVCQTNKLLNQINYNYLAKKKCNKLNCCQLLLNFDSWIRNLHFVDNSQM